MENLPAVQMKVETFLAYGGRGEDKWPEWRVERGTDGFAPIDTPYIIDFTLVEGDSKMRV